MTTIIKAYYENAGIAPFLLKRKLQLFERNHDIAEEFVEWIKTGKYPDRNCVCIEGFTAKMIASKSPLFAGEGAYMMLSSALFIRATMTVLLDALWRISC